jgi:hypothetical protein
VKAGQWLGLLAAGFVAWLTCPAPMSPRLSWGGVFSRAVIYVLLTSAACAAVMSIKVGSKTRRIVLRTSAAAAWLAPVAIFLFQGSMWAGIILIVLVVSLARFYRPPPALVPSPQMPFALGASLCLQSAAVAWLINRPASASMLVGAGAGIFVWRFAVAGALPERVSGPKPRVALTIILAILFAAAGLTRYLRPHLGFGSESAVLVTGAGSAEENAKHASENATTFDATDSYPGVILWPEAQPHIMLVPPLPAMGRALLDMKNPLSIPFYGVYWFLRPPNRRPPPNAINSKGTPTAILFRSTNSLPLTMEGHQNFGTLIDLSCCSRIQLAIRNADPYASLVFIELILVNTSLPGKPFQSLGMEGVTSKPNWISGATVPASETLTYPIPASPVIQRFDEMTIRFVRASARAQSSARISIERFVLVPRGY